MLWFGCPSSSIVFWGFFFFFGQMDTHIHTHSGMHPSWSAERWATVNNKGCLHAEERDMLPRKRGGKNEDWSVKTAHLGKTGPANLKPIINSAQGLQDTHTLGNFRSPETQSKVYFQNTAWRRKQRINRDQMF